MPHREWRVRAAAERAFGYVDGADRMKRGGVERVVFTSDASAISVEAAQKGGRV